MRLTVPEPKIELYKDGFKPGELDQLNRKPTGDKLSELVERIDDPLVIALDGSWGSGKSFFLKCWVGEHLQREGNTTQTVYFDAFKHDFLDDPLIALTDAIAARFEKNETLTPTEREGRVKKLKKFGWVLGKSSAKIGVSVAGHYAKKLVGEECLEEFGKELEKASKEGVVTAEEEIKTLIDSEIGDEDSETFWQEQRAKMVAMSAFRAALTELTEPKKNDRGLLAPTRKLVIVIDELDRCRPDYALSLLEIIKHFFNVDGVHFVLGVNLTELQNSVRARYGSEVDSETYLQKFVTMRMTLKDKTSATHDTKSIWIDYFHRISKEMDFPKETSQLLTTVELILGRLVLTRDLSLRDVERVLTTLATIPDLKSNFYTEIEVAIGTMAVLKALRPSVYRKYSALSEEKFDVEAHFDTSQMKQDRHSELIELAWNAIEDFEMLTDGEKEDLRQFSDPFGRQKWNGLLGRVANDLLEVFDFTDF
ncbi:hypothetical protein EBB79_17530 [Parasedimentitalea marina]|uniref:KAP NTPase domain-containing protein n=1 Tax=Parasedimentitalea marina TaxID=2483033 RepID=A0A3T0N695_9RHOB|nr:P-loop NTPase fold protein [Parasedimentitalea marina]AZV79491.1 hypothetical protein EBB79_17530 [Parasedimentitalea marina]